MKARERKRRVMRAMGATHVIELTVFGQELLAVLCARPWIVQQALQRAVKENWHGLVRTYRRGRHRRRGVHVL